MLTEDILDELLNWKEILQKLRIVNLTHNRILNERRAKNKVEDLKKLGIIVTLWFFIGIFDKNDNWRLMIIPMNHV